MSDHLDTRAARLAAALDDFLRSSPDVEAAAVVSFDGLPMASALPDELDEDRVGAMSAALLSLGEQAALGLGRGQLNQVFVQGDEGFVFLMSARDQAVLAAIAHRNAKIGFMLFEMRRTADRVGHVLEPQGSELVAPAEWDPGAATDDPVQAAVDAFSQTVPPAPEPASVEEPYHEPVAQGVEEAPFDLPNGFAPVAAPEPPRAYEPPPSFEPAASFEAGPVDDQAPANGFAPANGYAPTNHHAPADGYAPTNGHAPSNGYVASNGHEPTDGYVPTNGHAPTNGYTPVAAAPQVPPPAAPPAPAAPAAEEAMHRQAEDDHQADLMSVLATEPLTAGDDRDLLTEALFEVRRATGGDTVSSNSWARPEPSTNGWG
ncbi:roadblock/LC7 domain-containing protein [Egicoccus sp. AB-alg2]|uniref:roadblock/LC7 domain-containing protein n=1 Tax=Egicoccus sp. AB-alg2 TaxID=3242693 RepID=UPI00359E2F36